MITGGSKYAVVGAGPYGLAAARSLAHRGHAVQVIGTPMSFWSGHMPAGLRLRSPLDWDFSADQGWTLREFLETDHTDMKPLDRDAIVRYGRWFAQKTGTPVLENTVTNIARTDSGFVLTLENGKILECSATVIATGLRGTERRLKTLTENLLPGTYSHAYDHSTYAWARNRRVAILGGRQSAFEAAALLLENGAQRVEVIYRHETPRFEPSDWSFVDELKHRFRLRPNWFLKLGIEEQQRWAARFWSEGREKLEPWLLPRLQCERMSLRPGTTIQSVVACSDGLGVELSPGGLVHADHLLLATGFELSLESLTLLDESMRQRIACVKKLPRLSSTLESSVEGLFFTGMWAAESCGPAMSFLVACGIAAEALANNTKECQ